jgi:hypothetical protein
LKRILNVHDYPLLAMVCPSLVVQHQRCADGDQSTRE